jgi:hypothetical protein
MPTERNDNDPRAAQPTADPNIDANADALGSLCDMLADALHVDRDAVRFDARADVVCLSRTQAALTIERLRPLPTPTTGSGDTHPSGDTRHTFTLAATYGGTTDDLTTAATESVSYLAENLDPIGDHDLALTLTDSSGTVLVDYVYEAPADSD